MIFVTSAERVVGGKEIILDSEGEGLSGETVAADISEDIIDSAGSQSSASTRTFWVKFFFVKVNSRLGKAGVGGGVLTFLLRRIV